jgi:hypothetical protein
MAFPQRPKYYSNVASSATQRDMDNFIDKQWHWEPGNLDTCKMPGLHISTAQGSVEVKQHNADMLDALADIAYEQEQAMREQWDESMEDQHEPKD